MKILSRQRLLTRIELEDVGRRDASLRNLAILLPIKQQFHRMCSLPSLLFSPIIKRTSV